MSDYDSILSAAKRLPAEDRVRLIDALWDTVPPDQNAPFSDSWLHEIRQRVAELDAGTGRTIPWSEIREAGLARLGHGQAR